VSGAADIVRVPKLVLDVVGCAAAPVGVVDLVNVC
jgi:hypothetical protein